MNEMAVNSCGEREKSHHFALVGGSWFPLPLFYFMINHSMRRVYWGHVPRV